MHGRFKTDTATLIVVDPACVRHRIDDDADWWSIPEDELDEVNRGNALFVNLGLDGVFDFEITTAEPAASAKCANALIRNESGRFFIGAGEQMTSEGMEPEAVDGNVFVERPPGAYRVLVWTIENVLFINLTATTEPAGNALRGTPHIT